MPFAKLEDNAQQTQPQQHVEKIDESKRLSMEEIAKLKRKMNLLRRASLFVLIPTFVYVLLLIFTPLKDFLNFRWFFVFVVSFLAWYASHVVKFVKAWENAPVFKFGELVRILKPGLGFMFYPFEKIIFVDMWERERDVPEQSVDTMEGKATIDIRVFFKVVDAGEFLVAVKDPVGMVVGKAQGDVTSCAGKMTIEELLNERKELAEDIKGSLDADVFAWGMKITQIRFDNIKVPESVLASREKLAQANMDAQSVHVTADAQKYKVQAEADAEKYKLTAEAEGRAKDFELKAKALGVDGATKLVQIMVAGMMKDGDKFFIDPETVGIPLLKEIFGRK